MNALEFLTSRRSTPTLQLTDPGPDRTQLEQMLTLAMRVPDHGKLAPWRFVVLEGDAKRELGRRLAAMHLAREPDLSERKRDKDRERYEHAPIVVTVVARTWPEHPKVPVQEQIIAASYAAYNLLLAAHAMGFSGQILTGWAAYDREVAEMLGLTPDERIIGFVHLGTANRDMPERRRPELADKLSYWRP